MRHYPELKEALSQQALLRKRNELGTKPGDRRVRKSIQHRYYRVTEARSAKNVKMNNVTIIAPIIDTIVIQKILIHLDKALPNSEPVVQLPPLRAPLDEQQDAFIVQRDFDFGA